MTALTELPTNPVAVRAEPASQSEKGLTGHSRAYPHLDNVVGCR